MFLQANSEEFNNHSILPDLWSLSNYTPLIVIIIINEEFIQDKYWTIIKNSEEEESFVSKLKSEIGNTNITDISDSKSLERVVYKFVSILANLWNKYSKHVKITKHSKTWWNKEYNRDLNMYRTSKSIPD